MLTILPSSSTSAILLTSLAIYSCIPLKFIQYYIIIQVQCCQLSRIIWETPEILDSKISQKNHFLRFCKNIDLYSNKCIVSLTLSICLHNSLFWVQNNWPSFVALEATISYLFFKKFLNLLGPPPPLPRPSTSAVAMLPLKYSWKCDAIWLATLQGKSIGLF